MKPAYYWGLGVLIFLGIVLILDNLGWVSVTIN